MLRPAGVLCYNVFKLLSLLFIISAIATVVTVAEILKNNGLAVEKSESLLSCYSVCQRWRFSLTLQSNCIVEIMTSTVDVKDDSRSRPMQKAKIEIVLGKTENFDDLMAAAAEEREAAAADGEEQS
ncbi:hypothetical protein GUJ93_ZPchr0012g20552 [Zizania palustris]|uniref:Uncharacterized protein n=1 Tax=Zizania palustris TaxID=103762 RepID=A0A8J6BSC3_ZIZPA|nr:hypothetical protein GUJ93_ZPchr0012g20552 [Zizania palustris]